jgi:SAM-dependent methyltransferase
LVAPGQVIGVDLAGEMVAAANHKARGAGHESYRAVVGDARALAYGDESFDAVLCRFGLPFMPAAEGPVREMLRVLKSGRQACFALWAEPAQNPWIAIPLQAIYEALGEAQALEHRPGFFQFASAGRLEEMIDAAGLGRDIELGAVAGLRAVEGASRFWHTLRAAAAPVAAALARVPAAHRDAIDERVITAYSRYERAGRLELPYKAWLLTVTRV